MGVSQHCRCRSSWQVAKRAHLQVSSLPKVWHRSHPRWWLVSEANKVPTVQLGLRFLSDRKYHLTPRSGGRVGDKVPSPYTGARAAQSNH